MAQFERNDPRRQDQYDVTKQLDDTDTTLLDGESKILTDAVWEHKNLRFGYGKWTPRLSTKHNIYQLLQ